MKLFHQLDEKDQHNSIQYCLNLVIEDLMTGELELEAYNEKYKEMHEELLQVIEDAKALTEEEQFNYVLDSDASPLVFDIALDMARSAYYHSDEDLVIHYEGLRKEESTEEGAADEAANEILNNQDINTIPSRGKHSLN